METDPLFIRILLFIFCGINGSLQSKELEHKKEAFQDVTEFIFGTLIRQKLKLRIYLT
jgi:hypothetical protein